MILSVGIVATVPATPCLAWFYQVKIVRIEKPIGSYFSPSTTSEENLNTKRGQVGTIIPTLHLYGIISFRGLLFCLRRGRADMQ